MKEKVGEVSYRLDKANSQLRLAQTDIKSFTKFMDQRNDDSIRMHNILGEYKDRVSENFRMMTDEFT